MRRRLLHRRPLTATQHDVRGIQWVKNYKFDYNFRPWGQASVVFTCVAGHIQSSDFHDRYRKWMSCAPADLFDAPIQTFVAEVWLIVSWGS
jgi:DNA topoisomerase III